jgi:hypothetical protein
MRTYQRLAVVVHLVQIGFGGGRSNGRRPGCVGFVAGFDTHTQFHPVAKVAAKGVNDRCSQVPLNFILDEVAWHCEQRESLRDGEWPHQLEPRALLGRQRWIQQGDVGIGRDVGLAV